MSESMEYTRLVRNVCILRQLTGYPISGQNATDRQSRGASEVATLPGGGTSVIDTVSVRDPASQRNGDESMARLYVPARCKACVVKDVGTETGGGGEAWFTVAMPSRGYAGLPEPPATARDQLGAIRYVHFVPLGMSYLSLPNCGVALLPG